MAGETTAVTTNKRKFRTTAPVIGQTWSLAYAAAELELNDVKQFGYVPAGMTVVGFIYAPTDLDTNGSPAVVQKITIGSTDVATGLTGGQTGTASFVAIRPVSVTADTLVTVTTTTAAATAAAGTVNLTVLYSAALPLT
jgi:hypothetical protein